MEIDENILSINFRILRPHLPSLAWQSGGARAKCQKILLTDNSIYIKILASLKRGFELTGPPPG